MEVSQFTVEGLGFRASGSQKLDASIKIGVPTIMENQMEKNTGKQHGNLYFVGGYTD